jgi:hypothetical protein
MARLSFRIQSAQIVKRKKKDLAKAVLRGKFIAITAYIERTESSQLNDPMLHLKLLEKQK